MHVNAELKVILSLFSSLRTWLQFCI